MLLFMMLWMTVFHNRWQNVRDFMVRTYSPESVKYLSGMILISAYMIIIFARGLILPNVVEEAKLKKGSPKSLTVQNYILCLLLNFGNGQCQHSVKDFIWITGRKLRKLSEFYFTVLPSSEFLFFERNNSRGNLLRFIWFLIAHLTSSIPERQKFVSPLR